MAVAIRLARQGSKKKPFYRVVASDKRAPRDGRFIEQLGYYDPRHKLIKVDHERYKRWVEHGARATETVATLVKQAVRKGGDSGEAVRL